LGKSIEELEKKFEGVNVSALAVGASIGAIAIGTGAAVVGATKYLANLGDSFNSAVNDIGAGTGMVGQELEGMSEVLKDVYGSNFGESMEDAAAGITAVYQATGLTEDALADTTKAAYALSDTFGYDIAESARAAKAMMTNFGVSGEEAMGLIAAGAQNGLDYSGELIDSISEYSVQFSKLGFSADDMFNIFQQGADSGAWNLDKVGDAVKEFSIRSIDGSKTTTEAFEALGLNAGEMMQTFAAGGDGASIAFQGVLGSLMEMDDEVQRDAIGVKLFGTQWEDLGTEAMAALADINEGAYDTEDALGKINDIKYDNLGAAFEGIKRQAEVALLPLASAIANALTAIAPVIGDLFTQLGPIITQTTELMMPFVTEFLDGMMLALQSIVPTLTDLAAVILPMLGTFVSQLLPPLLDLIMQILPPVMQIVQALLPALSQVLLAILPMLTQLLSAILPVIVSLMAQLLPILTPILDVAIMLLNDVVMPLIAPLMTLVQALLPVIAPILALIASSLQPVLSLLGPLAGVLGDVVGFISEIVGWVAKGLNWVVDLIFGDGAGDIAKVAAAEGFATGGFTNGLSIAGEDPRYPTEAVISFNPAYRSQNLAYWAQAGRMLGADTADYSLGTTGGGSYVDFGGVTFAPNITVSGNADKESIMEAIEAEYPEFLDMLEEYFMQRSVTTYA
jgi:TP901 family phage tail tape measure protein